MHMHVHTHAHLHPSTHSLLAVRTFRSSGRLGSSSGLGSAHTLLDLPSHHAHLAHEAMYEE
jgi:hypothetical protein